jgi:DNA polymerase III sliding clamp (beta) subunit (PCNA family)
MADFQNYDRVIPKDNHIEISIGKSEILTALKQVKPFLNKKYSGIKLNFDASR